MIEERRFEAILLTAGILSFLSTFLMQPIVTEVVTAGVEVALAEVFLSTFNLLLLGVLTSSYLSVYRELGTEIARNLVVFSSALTLYALTSSPILHLLIEVELVNIGPLTYIPEIFVAAASVTLLYENYK